MKSAFLWSLVHCATTMVKQHVVLQSPLMGYHSLLQQTLTFLHSSNSNPDWKLIRFSNDIPPDSFPQETIVPMSRVFRERRDSHLLFSRSHYLQFSRSVYASLMEYTDYCAMEDKLAHIVFQYLHDQKNHWIITMDDPFLMGSLRQYGDKETVVEQTTWITLEPTTFSDMIIVDMDTDHPRV